MFHLLSTDRKAHRNGIKKPIRKIHESTLGVRENPLNVCTIEHFIIAVFRCLDGRQVCAQPAIRSQGQCRSGRGSQASRREESQPADSPQARRPVGWKHSWNMFVVDLK